MKKTKLAVSALLLAAGAMTAGSALAWGDHHHGHGGSHLFLGFNFGMPYYAPAYYYPAPIYYPAPVVVQQQPQVYTERSDIAPAPEAQNYWYYCEGARGYYPYVKECPGGWQRVPAAPAR